MSEFIKSLVLWTLFAVCLLLFVPLIVLLSFLSTQCLVYLCITLFVLATTIYAFIPWIKSRINSLVLDTIDDLKIGLTKIISFAKEAAKLESIGMFFCYIATGAFIVEAYYLLFMCSNWIKNGEWHSMTVHQWLSKKLIISASDCFHVPSAIGVEKILNYFLFSSIDTFLILVILISGGMSTFIFWVDPKN